MHILHQPLLNSHKYKYGILAYEAAITAHKLLQSCLHDALVRRLATVCLDNGDVDRALKYVWCLPVPVCVLRYIALRAVVYATCTCHDYKVSEQVPIAYVLTVPLPFTMI